MGNFILLGILLQFDLVLFIYVLVEGGQRKNRFNYFKEKAKVMRAESVVRKFSY